MIHQIICVKSGYMYSGDLHKLHNASLYSTVTGGEIEPGNSQPCFVTGGRRGSSLPSLRERSSVREDWPVTEGRL